VETQIEVPMPLDSDSYLRRACVSCNREFKWLPQGHGLTTPVDGYHCPYCNHAADPDAWWTEAQLAFAHAHAANLATDEINKAFRGLSRNTGPLRLTVTPIRHQQIPHILEADDMTQVTFDCHPSEPVKIVDTWTATVYCLYCGQPNREAVS
jgi:DNA-directed RNA polymerase subunit RPC12/RpoP